ncbi:MAG: hypothetical protein MUE30_15765 [Spirosomaceae bacterium]|jgi:hypothetical protein|nr:hypothetical protein [Spirosomataceae bacterium]
MKASLILSFLWVPQILATEAQTSTKNFKRLLKMFAGEYETVGAYGYYPGGQRRNGQNPFWQT